MKNALMIRAANAAEMVKLLLAESQVNLAMEIADATVRSDIEMFAKEVYSEGVRYYDTSATVEEDSKTQADALDRSIRYIDKRGDALPFVMKRHIGCKTLVWFEDKAPEVAA